MDFESKLKDRTAPIAIDFDTKKNVLLIAFAGLRHQLGFPMFEFNNITSGLKDINKIYLRDQQNVWFHRGLPNAGANIDGIADFLRKYTTHQSTQRIIIFGNCGGGYAALLFGHLLQASEVHAFAPKTFLNPIRRLIQNDIPYRNQIRFLLRLLFRGQRKYFDLKKVLLASPREHQNLHIHYLSNHRIDNLHALRMKVIASIHLHPYQYEQHNLIKDLKQSGKLSEIIEKAIELKN